MESILQIARLFSAGKFDLAAPHLSETVAFHIYEDDTHLTNKTQVLEFCSGIADYFASVQTNFQESGHLVSGDKVVIYGFGEFRRDGELINLVNSCDVYEFNAQGMVDQIHSYCNSKKLI